MKRSDTVRPSVIYDPDAVAELLAMKSKEEHRALLNAVRKLGELGEQLGPPHVKPLKGSQAASLREQALERNGPLSITVPASIEKTAEDLVPALAAV